MRHATAGPEALRAVSRLLGLEAKGLRLDGLCVEDGARARLWLRKGEERLEYKAEKLGPARQKRVIGLVASDPATFVEELDPASNGDRVRVPYVAGPMGLLEAGWRNFFADQDFEILMEAPEPTPNNTVTVEYADLECFCARPDISFSQWSFLDWPDESVELGEAGEDAFVAVELQEQDMVMGTGEKADELVSEVRRLADAGNYMVVTHLCTPIVMGEDFQALAKRCEDEIGGTSVSWSQKDRDRGDNFGEHFRSLLARPGFLDGPGDAAAVNLFHVPTEVREGQLRPFLEELGLTVGVTVFPVVDFPSLERLPRARWQVFWEKPSYADKTLEFMRAASRPVVMARAPYGVRGARDCLRSIAVAVGKEAEFEAAWAKRTAAFLPSWEARRKEAAAFRLAFVVSEAILPRLLGLRYGHGAPLASMVREMGFGVDLLYFDRHGKAPELPAGLEGASVKTFRSPAELEALLREGESRAVYSDIFFDWRVSSAGKSRFSSRDFEMGLDGASRTMDRLLNACRLPFYRRYGARLSKLGRRVNV
ncbi:MAG: hypothetical protein HYX59_06440 [Elusimicrobia bacterium]|nr:hypothetical protein [Elusimicrobiota bacterium]